MNKTTQEFQLKPGMNLDNKYQLVEQIATGGMNSVIWKAQALNPTTPYTKYSNPYVALKIITLKQDDKNNNEQTQGLQRELFATNAAASQNSDVFCSIYDFFWINNNQTFCIVMEYVDGLQMDKYLKKKGLLPVVEAMDIYEKILLGLKSLHQGGQKNNEVILHRDLKLSNIMLTYDYSRVKIIDLGIATILNNSDKRSLKIQETQVYGSKGYVPPEVKKLNSRQNNNEKAQIINEFWDIFAAGVILYNLLTGEMPYNTKDSHVNIFTKPEVYDFPTVSSFVPDISPIIENIIYKSIVSFEHEKHHRYKNVQEVLDDIQLWKTNPHNQSISIIKPDSERKLENIDRLLTIEAGYEISAILWTRSLICYGILFVISMIVINLLIFFI